MAEETGTVAHEELLGERFVVSGEEPLAELDTPGGRAFAVTDQEGAKQPLFALVCDPSVPTRVEAIRSVRGLGSANMLRLVETGVVTVRALGARRLVLIYQRPPGSRLGLPGAGPYSTIPESEIVGTLLRPVATALAGLHKRGVCHGRIHPSNLFLSDGAESQIVLGDCLSAPEGWSAPASFEPIERAMAIPVGRGPATPADDCYALGVTALALLIGKDPADGLDQAAMIDARSSRGSFEVLVGRAQISAGFAALLGRLLDDAPAQRFDMRQVVRWADAKVQISDKGKPTKRERWPLQFEGQAYREPREMAIALTRHPAEGAAVVRGTKLSDWLRHSVSDRFMADAAATLQQPDKPVARVRPSSDDEIIARAAIILDPGAPIRFHDLAVMPGGIGAAVAASLASQDETQIAQIESLSRLIGRELPVAWTRAQKKPSAGEQLLRRKFSSMPKLLRRTEPGFGIERVLYELNPTMPCLSPLLANDYVAELAELLPALERIAANAATRKGDPMDRHLAAFIAHRLELSTGHVFSDLAAAASRPEQYRRATLMLFSTIQQQLSVPPVPALTQWIGQRLDIVVEEYKNRKLRKQLADRLKQVSAGGNLRKMLRLVSDQKLRKRDQARFAAARRDYAVLRKSIYRLQSDAAERATRVTEMGRKIASYSAYALLALSAGVVLSVIGLGSG